MRKTETMGCGAALRYGDLSLPGRAHLALVNCNFPPVLLLHYHNKSLTVSHVPPTPSTSHHHCSPLAVDDPSSLCSTPSHHSANRQLVADALRMRAGLFCVFPYLDIHSLLCAAEVCSDWRFVARHPAVWTRLRLENARVSSEVQKGLTCRHRQPVASLSSHHPPCVCVFSFSELSLSGVLKPNPSFLQI